MTDKDIEAFKSRAKPWLPGQPFKCEWVVESDALVLVISAMVKGEELSMRGRFTPQHVRSKQANLVESFVDCVTQSYKRQTA